MIFDLFNIIKFCHFWAISRKQIACFDLFMINLSILFMSEISFVFLLCFQQKKKKLNCVCNVKDIVNKYRKLRMD